ncbi:MAG TPA: hypothetical protein VJ803_11510 [Gemmatimonadaceae bacterium]|nr:hypothetical protein [Gemmatimonadaceae bacterium]
MLLAIACGSDRAPDATDESTPAAPAVAHSAIQFAAFTDSSAAARLRDSLGRAGWNTYVRRSMDAGRRLWRVRALPTTAPALGRLAAFAFNRTDGETRQVTVVADTGALTGPHVSELFRVNTGSPGMIRRARWALSSDRRAILVVEDPTAVENEPVPNGFFFGGEPGMRRIQMDSVWDVSPSPDWTRVAFGRAYVTFARENVDTLSDAAWRVLAERAGLPEREARASAFAASAMALAVGLSRPGILELDSGERQLFPVAGGWRVRWSADGRRLAVSAGPRMVADDGEPRGWFGLDPVAGASANRLPAPTTLAEVSWVDGPTMDISIPQDLERRVTLPIEDGQVESSSGWIRVLGRIVGPGAALATTRSGRFVVALIPDPDAGEYDAKEMLAVYVVAR